MGKKEGLEIIESQEITVPRGSTISGAFDSLAELIDTSKYGLPVDGRVRRDYLARFNGGTTPTMEDLRAQISAFTLPERQEAYSFEEIARLRKEAGLAALATIQELTVMASMPLVRRVTVEVGGEQGARSVIPTYHLMDTSWESHGGEFYLQCRVDRISDHWVDKVRLSLASLVDGVMAGEFNIFFGQKPLQPNALEEE